MSADIRICFIGDSLVTGAGDSSNLGWVGRVCAAANQFGFHVTSYNLGIRRETSGDVAQRWQQECRLRQPADADNRMVFAFGVNDTTIENQQCRVDPLESVANARAIISGAKILGPVLWLGPTPVQENDQSQRIAQLDQAYSEIASDLKIPYLSVFEPLRTTGPWLDELRAGDGSHPGQDGYVQLAGLVKQWPAWWFHQAITQGLEL